MYSVELEKLKYEQQKNIEEEKTVFNRMHEKRSEIIAELYSKLSDVIDDASYAMAVIENTAMPSKTERFNTMCSRRSLTSDSSSIEIGSTLVMTLNQRSTFLLVL